MKILIVSQYFYPEQFNINEIAAELVKRGNEVVVITGLPNYPQGKVLSEYKHGKNREETYEGVKIIRTFESDRRDGAIGLALNYTSFAFSAAVKTLFMKEKFDVVFCYQLSPVTQAIPAIVYKTIHHTKMKLYCLDIFPEAVKSHIS